MIFNSVIFQSSLFIDSVVIAETLEVRENFKQLKVKYEAQKSKSVEFLISVYHAG